MSLCDNSLDLLSSYGVPVPEQGEPFNISAIVNPVFNHWCAQKPSDKIVTLYLRHNIIHRLWLQRAGQSSGYRRLHKATIRFEPSPVHLTHISALSLGHELESDGS
ncbi:hypothetical protein CEXT_66581 [Caerostris extrusa]|uniref:Uncharacterized protein n=1 Tax=Caerostris extrusa TaxID=172846 RepID=A0AAV4MMZ8_CAEEX|nr:hypothetical protein CEXT_66581 [Caerostris extrusa]